MFLLQVHAGNAEEDTNRMSTCRCAELMVTAVANRLSEVWISHHPVLFITYCMQYLPSIAFRSVLLDVNTVLCLYVSEMSYFVSNGM